VARILFSEPLRVHAFEEPDAGAPIFASRLADGL
jgi:hypothetical protein